VQAPALPALPQTGDKDTEERQEVPKVRGVKLFELRRKIDISGVSGIGTVAQGVIFDNGKVALTWLTPFTSVTVYENLNHVIAVHGHDGATQIVQIADLSDENEFMKPFREKILNSGTEELSK